MAFQWRLGKRRRGLSPRICAACVANADSYSTHQQVCPVIKTKCLPDCTCNNNCSPTSRGIHLISEVLYQASMAALKITVKLSGLTQQAFYEFTGSVSQELLDGSGQGSLSGLQSSCQPSTVTGRLGQGWRVCFHDHSPVSCPPDHQYDRS